jgi:hypothetical protein
VKYTVKFNYRISESGPRTEGMKLDTVEADSIDCALAQVRERFQKEVSARNPLAAVESFNVEAVAAHD